MGTIVRINGFEVLVHGREHGVVHANVWYGGAEAVVAVGIEPGGAYLLRPSRMGLERRWAVRLVNAHRGAIILEWRRLNGKA